MRGGDFLEPVCQGKEGLYNVGIELGATALPDLLHGRLVREGGLVGPFGDQGVIDVRYSHHTARNGDIVPCQPLRVSCAVPAFVVGQGNFPGQAQE